MWILLGHLILQKSAASLKLICTKGRVDLGYQHENLSFV